MKVSIGCPLALGHLGKIMTSDAKWPPSFCKEQATLGRCSHSLDTENSLHTCLACCQHFSYAFSQGSSSWQNADFRCSPSNVARPWSRKLGDFSAMERATPSTSPVWTCGGPVQAEVHFLTPALLKSYYSYFTFLFHIKTHRHVLLGWCQHCTLHGHMWLANCNFASRTLKNHVLWLNIACVFGIHPTKRFSKMFARPWWSVGNSTLRGLNSSSSLCSNCPNINYSGDVLKKDRARGEVCET